MTKKPVILLPQWLNIATWKEYVAMRKHIRKPMTHRAMELAIGNLEKLMVEGEDPNKVMEQSIFNSWQGLFPVRQSGRQQFNGRTNATDAVKATLRNFGIPN